MQNRREKQGFVLLAAVSLAVIVLLAAAVGSFTFASPYELLKDNCSTATSSQSVSENCNSTDGLISYAALLRLFVILFLLLVPVLVYMLARAPRYRRWLLLFLLPFFVLVYAISNARSIPLLPEQSGIIGGIVVTEEAESPTPEPTLAPAPDPGTARVTPVLVWLLSLGVAGLLLGLVVAAYLLVRAYRSRPVSPLEAIAASAEATLQILEQGGDFRDAILRCYSTMLEAASERGVDRPGYLTPAEFSRRLVQAGLPAGAVERLTHLFELVRYSPQRPTTVMETEALDCLQTVMQAARGNS